MTRETTVSRAFTYDLGVFDPTFPGITLHIPNEATWESSGRVSRILGGLLIDDIIQGNPRLGARDITWDQTIKHVLATPGGLTKDPALRAGLGRLLVEDPEQAIGNLGAMTVHVHERRHFHDWLLSPYAAAINALRIEVGMNYRGLHPILTDGGVTVLPVPLTRWLRKGAAERDELIQMWQLLLGDSVKVRVPQITRADVLEAIAYIERRYQSISMLFENLHGTGLSATAVFEASALCMQTQTIHDLLGEQASSLFFGAMSQQKGSPYFWFIQGVNRFARPGEPIEMNMLSTLATWCLLGSSNIDKSNSHPVTRMGHVMKYLGEHGLADMHTPAHEIFTGLDKSCGTVPYADGLRLSVELGESILRDFHSAAAPATSNYIKGMVQTYEFFFECHKYMVGAFLLDPDGYAKPGGYLDRNLEKWPEPPMRYTFGRPFFEVSRADLARYERPKLFEAESTPEKVFLREFTTRGPDAKASFDLQYADNWEHLCGSADVVFAEFNRDQPAIEFHREQSRRSGLHLLEVLS